jgi:hypothetical protein
MRSKLFADKPETVKTMSGRWIRIMPDEGEGHYLYDVFKESYIGRVLVDGDDNWIYDGYHLNVYEQEDVAGVITKNQQEMNELIKSL